MTPMRPSLFAIASFLLAYVAAQGPDIDGEAAGHDRATASLQRSRSTWHSSPQLSLRQQEIDLMPSFCKKTVTSLKKHALHKIHMLNHTLVTVKHDLTREQKLRTAAEQSLNRERSLRSAAEQNASSLASQLASLKQAEAKAKAELQQLADELKLRRTEVPKLTEKLKLVSKVVATEKAKVAVEERRATSALRVATAERRLRQQMKQQLNQTRQELAQKSEALTLINSTSSKKSQELNATRAQLSAEEAQLRSATNEVTNLSLALQEETEVAVKHEVDAKKLDQALQEETEVAVKQKMDAAKLEQNDMKQMIDLMGHVDLLSDKIAHLTASNAEENATEIVLEAKLLSANKEIESEKKGMISAKQQLNISRDENKKLNAKVQSLAKSLDTEKETAAKDALHFRLELANATREISNEEKKLKAARTDAMEKIKAARTDAMEKIAKLTKAESDRSVANLKVDKELREKLHAAEVSVETTSKMLKATSDDAKKLRVNLYSSEATLHWNEATAKLEADELNATVKNVQKLGAELSHARTSLSAKDQELSAKDQELKTEQEELKAATEETSKLGGSLRLLKIRKEQELKSALLNSDRLKAKLAKLYVDKRHEDQEQDRELKETRKLEGKLHDVQAELDSARSEIRTLGSKSESDSAQLAKLRSSLRGVSKVATKQTQAFRNFEYIDEQLRADIHNAVAETPPSALEQGPNTGMVEVKAIESPSMEKVKLSLPLEGPRAL